MTTSAHHNYIAQLLEPAVWRAPTMSAAAYNSHLLPKLMNPQWEQAFESATHQQRANLACGWLWSYAVKSDLRKLDSYGQAKNWCIERCASWIQKIEPYAPTEDLAGDPTAYRKTYELLLRRSDSVPDSVLRPLWFGTDNEKLSLLLVMLNDRRTLDAVADSLPSHNRVFEILDLPGATLQHAICAAYVAIRTGMRRLETTPAINLRFEKWHNLGRRIVEPRPLYPNDEINLLNSRLFLSTQPPAVAVPALTRIINDELTGPFRSISLGSMFWKPGDTAAEVVTVTIENIYAALDDWLPDYRQQWEAASALGMSVLESGEAVALSLAGADDRVALPANLEMM